MALAPGDDKESTQNVQRNETHGLARQMMDTRTNKRRSGREMVFDKASTLYTYINRAFFLSAGHMLQTPAPLDVYDI
jgi:hypothetical protein